MEEQRFPKPRVARSTRAWGIFFRQPQVAALSLITVMASLAVYSATVALCIFLTL